MIRTAVAEDVSAMLAIYAPYVRDTAISFEIEPPSLEAFAARYDAVSRRYPWIVWEENGETLGYAYADAAFSRAAYAWDADLSIYLREDARGRGIGDRLYDCIEELMRRLGYHTLYALVTGENAPSLRFHARRGYECQGVLKRTGFKFDRWHDVHWLALRLCSAEAPTSLPAAFEDTPQAREVMRIASEK